MVRREKKASIELSLNLIIMLIIGMVVLGLVIGFVNSLVGKGTQSFDKQLGDNEKLKLEEVQNSPNNLAISPEPSLILKKGSKTNVFIKVRAYGDPIEITPGELPQGDTGIMSYKVLDASGVDASGALILTGPGFKANNGKEDAKMYTLKTGDSASVGTYYLTIGLYDSETSKTITVDVK